jgi:hypothetical protein
MNKMHIFTTAFENGSCAKCSPKNFQWIFNSYPKTLEPVVYFDDFIFRQLKDEYPGIKYGWLGESSEIIAHIINAIIQNKPILKAIYKNIFTNDRRLINLDPEFFLYNPPASNVPWITKPQIYEKNKLCSYITSFKKYTTGHTKRLELFDQLKDNPTFKDHIFGREYRFIEDKIDGLKDYMFSIVIENSIYPKYYTEKVMDAFACGTVPIYYGDRSIAEDFDERGIIFLDELSDWSELSPDLYYSKLDYIQKNYITAINMETADDIIYRSISELNR